MPDLIGAAVGRFERAVDWLRRNLFSSAWNTLLTLLVLAALWIVVPPFLDWAVWSAAISGASKAICSGGGACWTFIKLRLHTFIWGHYPSEELWRPAAAVALLVAFAAPVMREQVRHRGLYVLLLLTVCPVLAGVLLVGDVAGLKHVDTSQWGGLMLDVIISFVTVAGAIPLGILLALGRRAELKVIRVLSIGFIELWRGVPLLTVLFMSAVMVPLFMPDGVHVDRLIRAMVAFTLFNAAYMAETVRGGLQGVPVGQEEAAYSIGLRWWQVQVFVTLPQALRIVVPGIVNNIVDLFKDTSLVTIIGLVDLLGAVNQSLKDPAWLGLAKEGYVFTSVLFFACCFAMSSYGRRFERRLNRHRTGGQ
ncbi:MAG: amino acid ABC transporter permease [Proteobacteria bacterium]|nr:amino acid ABC transporter permease [Pseudomonadota bacterium]